MDDISLLHDAARRYCIDRANELRLAYARLPGERCTRPRGKHGWVYTNEALDIFPRYHTLDAILQEIERFVPSDFASLEELRVLLAAAGETASNSMTRRPTAEVEIAAICDERSRFAAFITSAKPASSASSAPLPFRRVLGVAESAEFERRFEQRWGRWYGGCVDGGHCKSYVTLHTAAMSAENAYRSLKDAIGRQGVSRLIELREGGEACELEINAVSFNGLSSFSYDGQEGFWTDRSLEWMVYASHESSITFGGYWLIDAMRLALPEFDRYIYRGWDDRLYALEVQSPSAPPHETQR